MIDQSFLIKKIRDAKEVYVLYSKYTNVPYMECDPETYDDQIYIFSEEEEAREFIDEYAERKILLVMQKVSKADQLQALAKLHGLGVNAIVFHNNRTHARIQMETLVKKPDLEKLKTVSFPMFNPTLNLSVVYFLQEIFRSAEHDQQHLKELEEEMIANLVRSKYILTMTTADPKEKFDPKNPAQPKRLCYIKNKDGQMLLPIFSDIGEMANFYKEKAHEVGMALVTFENLAKSIAKDAVGIVLNPAGYHLYIGRDQLEQTISRYC